MPPWTSANDLRPRRSVLPDAAPTATTIAPQPAEAPPPTSEVPEAAPRWAASHLDSSTTIAEQPRSAAVSLDATEKENPHIVGPATAGDSHFLEDYLSSIQEGGHGRAIRPILPGVTSTPVMFMRVRKRPVGLAVDLNPSSAELQTIVKLLEPWQDAVLNLYFSRGNGCFPVLDEGYFREYVSRSRVSPAVVACLYAHAMCYWSSDPNLSRHHRPDARFIWNLALEALYSELHISPGMPSIIAILLNIGGRPTTTMVGNGMLLGCAISLAHSLGLNRNPIAWNITEGEKTFRMQIWWCLVIHDRWTSLTYGTPPHIRQSHHDVPIPKANQHDERAQVFEALASLTIVLGAYIEQLYAAGDVTDRDPALAFSLDIWTDTLFGELRRIIVRGMNLDTPGAANLRLCYLAARFFMCRVELSTEVDDYIPGQSPNDRLLKTRRMAEDIVHFVRELTAKQLGDFWLPTAAFVFSSTTTFLVRLAVQAELPTCETSMQSLSLSLAHDLVTSLRSHKDLYGWELGDICIAQYGDVVDKLWSQNPASHLDPAWLDSAPFIPDPGFFESVIVDQWDPLAWCQAP
ncbi:hypothetical protein JDV02_004589 [Purpureocillium takamizusanense]|uniref:Xylanolytic transcriptional activator regulatory domain-containing protein n=1 Tax=Purpureocillium takamizusanense TaxID=2060973 RepID=A0A9Q8QEV5_9HYPO|nr:uncharacterized protein JDV02_004589 [Purpureocillium takamizusanense]UNI18315.1 hypothetical protein JDV02_004589 [Purpureocillium takamizusanense]